MGIPHFTHYGLRTEYSIQDSVQNYMTPLPPMRWERWICSKATGALRQVLHGVGKLLYRLAGDLFRKSGNI